MPRPSREQNAKPAARKAAARGGRRTPRAKADNTTTPAQGAPSPAEDRPQAPSPAEVDDSLEFDGEYDELHGEAGDDPGLDATSEGSLASRHGRRGHLDPKFRYRDTEDEGGVFGTNWLEPALLEAPPPREGMVQRWVRVENRDGKADAQNVSRALRVGWHPRDPETVQGQISAPTLNHGTFGQCIAVEGMVLMEMPEERAEMRQKHFDRKNVRLEEAITQDLRQVSQESGGPPILRQQRTQVSHRRRRPPAQA